MSSTALKQDLLAAAVESMLPGELSAVRKKAAETFSAMGFPTVKDEDWKYTNLDAVAKLSNDWLRVFPGESRGETQADVDQAAIARLKQDIDAHWLTIRNGIVDAATLDEISDIVGDGVDISRLSDGVAGAAVQTDDPMSAFNAALLRDGLHIHAKNAARADKPIGLLFVDDGVDTLSQARVIIDCEDNAELKIIECAMSGGDAQFANLVIQVKLAAGARLDYVRIQQRDHAHLGINRLTANLEKESILNHCAFDFGSALARNDIDVNIAGAGAEANLHGLYLAAQAQHIDNHLRVIHSVGPATSTQNYRGILNGRSRCVFNGKAQVLQGADGTDAKQTNHNLLLSDRAEIDTKPELEIYADDVKCSHGATVGQLDDAAVFYLQTRGLSKNDAKLVLTRAFASEVLSVLTIAECREYLSRSLEQRLDELIDDDSR